jgi:hypothetical protein
MGLAVGGASVIVLCTSRKCRRPPKRGRIVRAYPPPYRFAWEMGCHEGVGCVGEELAGDDHEFVYGYDLTRCWLGASSDKNTLTVAEAPPTASPKTKRAATMNSVFGAMAHPTAPMKKMTASSMMVRLRPCLSESRPPRVLSRILRRIPVKRSPRPLRPPKVPVLLARERGS